MLELIIYNVRKSRPEPDETLRAYCATFGLGRAKLEQMALKCDVIGEAQLRHVRSLYEIVEGLVSDAVLPTVPERFRAPLPDAVAAADRACLALGARAGRSDAAAMKSGLRRLEPVLKTFISRRLKESTDVEPTVALFQYAAWGYFAWGDDEPSVDELQQAFPDTSDGPVGALLTAAHACALHEELRRRGGGGAGQVAYIYGSNMGPRRAGGLVRAAPLARPFNIGCPSVPT